MRVCHSLVSSKECVCYSFVFDCWVCMQSMSWICFVCWVYVTVKALSSRAGMCAVVRRPP